MNVALLTYTENPERVIATAAKTCYAPGTALHMWDSLAMEPTQVVPFIKKLRDINHMSPFEHANFTFAVDGISRICSHQLVRHRMASYSQQSQRYVTYDNIDLLDDFVYPLDLDDDHQDREVFTMMEYAYANAAESYGSIMHYLTKVVGMKEKEAAENARYVLPGAMTTNIIVTMNARELIHFFSLRCCNRAQQEIRDLAWEINLLLVEKFPTVFESTGPSCITDKCKEGKMSCGNPYKKGK